MAADFGRLGLKAGLEIHQQLDTPSKLFCSCPSVVRDDQPDVVVERRLRASAGETGELDAAAAYEQARSKSFVYQAYNDTVCGVELDEEPVHDVSSEALKIALQVSLLLKARPLDSVQVMRKTVVDGSNTSGFQRTALVAMNGAVEINSSSFGITSVCVEEESAKIVKRSSDKDVYNLSRLGIPLVEIATAADMGNPEEVRQVAEHIGMMLRSTGKVRRGLGTIRQDVNVSIKGGSRVEIKGAQELKLLPRIVEYEAFRQKGLADAAAELEKRRASADGKSVDVTDLLSRCDSGIIRQVMEKGGVVLAARLSGFAGLIGKDFGNAPGRRLGKELSEHARCYGSVGGVLHSDELPKHGITQAYVDSVRKKLGCKYADAFVMVAAGRENAEAGLGAAVERARQAIKGVPSEVRKANPDGTTTFLRPMPGSARMYPETDVKLIGLKQYMNGLKLPKLLSDKVSDYRKLGMSAELARAVLSGRHAAIFEELVASCRNLSAAYIADFLLSYGNELQRLQFSAESAGSISEEWLRSVLKAIDRSELAKESAVNALADAAKSGRLDLSKHRTLSDSELEEELKKIMAENRNLPFNVLIGKAMLRLRGKAPGRVVVEKLKSLSGQSR